MNHRELGDMFMETSFGEDIGGIKDEDFMIDFDLDIGNLSVCPPPYQSSFVAADISSLSMIESEVSGADLLSAFDAIRVNESLEPKDSIAPDIDADTFDSVGQAYLSSRCPGDGNDNSNFGSSDLAVVVAEPFAEGDGESKVLVDIEKTCTQSPSLIEYTSSRRRSAHNTKSSQTNKSPKPLKCGRVANKSSEFDLLPDIDQSSVDQNLGNERRLRREKGGKGKRKGIRDQTGKRSAAKSLIPTGRISLKVKIGNKICSLGNPVENFSSSGKDISGLIDSKKNKLGEEVFKDISSPCERNLEKVMSSDGPALSTHLHIQGPFYNQSVVTSSDFHKTRSLEEGDNSRGLTDIRCSDVGTSPDSEVINSTPDISVCEKVLPGLQDGPTLLEAHVSSMGISNLIFSPKHSEKVKKKKKKKKKVKLHQVDDCMLGSKVTDADTGNNAAASVSMKARKKTKEARKKDKLFKVDNSGLETNLAAIETLNKANIPTDLGVSDISDYNDAYKRAEKPYLNGEDMKPCSGVVTNAVSDSPVCNTLIPCSNGIKFPKCSSGKERSKGRSRNITDEIEAASKNKGNKNDLNGNETPFDVGGTEALINSVTGPINKLQLSTDGERKQHGPLRNAWVLCDECQKWRRIQAALADQIEETNCGWTCQDNTDEDFADCSIPQEKSNSEINEELEISDGSCEEDACGTFQKPKQDRSKAAQQSHWGLIKSNLFLHRKRKTQTIDEVMVCHCKPPSDGRMGCGAKCLNRMLNIECVQGTCPCGDLCSNQQFQRRKYSKVKLFRCGKKGYGLQALEDMPEGFLIEYVGEVLDVHAYEARQREYAIKGHRHFYFMTLNGSEVIDASAKGNMGRFINHSCDPNCRTEKWMVNGEVSIGLISLRDIKKAEEVTFDYNFVRVFGAAAKKCECGSANCRGYIGGDLTNSEVIAQDDSDDEFIEPVMICEGKDMNKDWNDIILNNSNACIDETAKEPSENIYRMKKVIGTVGESITTAHTSETSPQKAEGVNSAEVAEISIGKGFGIYESNDNNSAANVVDELNNNKTTGGALKRATPAGHKVEREGIVSQMNVSSHVMDTTSESDSKVDQTMSSSHKSSHRKSLTNEIECMRSLKYAIVEGRDELEKSKTPTKTKRLSSIKKGKPKLNALKNKVAPDLDKSSAELHKSKKLPKLSLSHHLEAVEGKLNELLDPEGGISKRKDASRGYLKLLFLTAATGNNDHGEAIQSNRDLSMILDALLKTKSRTVLVDVISKNGLQMLHNILKRYRKEFIKTPILRKLLKVLEYLATREILTLEHITGGPACPGVESFKDSVLTLTEHDDKQVHQIARNFRDKWIPRSFRKTCCMDRDEYHQSASHGGLSVSYDHRTDRGGKPSEATNSIETESFSASFTAETSSLEPSASTSEPRTRKRKSRWDSPLEPPHSRNRNNFEGDDKHCIDDDDDIPPGFSTPCNIPIIPLDASTATHHQEREMQMKQRSLDIVLGDPWLRFSARIPVTYGIPYSIMQHFEFPQAEIVNGWTTAPGMPFHPFPPLPPSAPVEVDRSTSARSASTSAPIEMAAPSCDTCLTSQIDQQNTPENNGFQQGNAGSLTRKFFRQQKWNQPKLAPPWVRMRNGWGSSGNNARNVSPGVGLPNGGNDFSNSCDAEDYRREF